MTASLVTGPTHGSVSLIPDGSFTYTPDAGYYGTDQFQYKASDSTLASAPTNVVIQVVSPHLPIAVNLSENTDEDTAITDSLQASVPDGNPLTYVIVSDPAHGTISNFDSASGTFTYTPSANSNGSDSFTYEAINGSFTSAPATVSIQIAPVNDPPVASDLNLTTDEDTVLDGTLSATDVDSTTLTYHFLTLPKHGTVSQRISSNWFLYHGTFSYTPNSNFNGTDSFTYSVSDGQSDSNTATVTIVVNPVDDPPVSSQDHYTANSPQTLTVSADKGVLANDTDVEGDPLSAILVTPPRLGTLNLNADGSFTYTPRSLYAEVTDIFLYKASDGQRTGNQASVYIDIKPINAPPSATNSLVNVTTGTQVTFQPAAYDDLTPSSELIVSITSLPAHGTLYNGSAPVHVGDTFTGPPTLTFKPSTNPRYIGSDSFTYTVTDSSSQTTTGTLPIRIKDTNAHHPAQQGDFDGDGKADFAVFRPETATFYVALSSGGSIVQQWGWAGHDQPITADYDGDGKTDFAVFRPETATFYVKLSSGGTITKQFGWPGHDIPLTGDYDGDGKTDFAVFRPETATFYVALSSGGSLVKQWGWAGHDQPLVGDYDGDGKTDFAVFRPETATFYVMESSGKTIVQQFGWPGHDKPVTGDYDGDGKTDIAVYRPDDATYYVALSTGGTLTRQYGWVGHDQPIVGDYAGYGFTSIAIYRPETSTFYVMNSSGFTVKQLGWSGHDQPITDNQGGIDSSLYLIGSNPPTNTVVAQAFPTTSKKTTSLRRLS